jgi:hypothetical protein
VASVGRSNPAAATRYSALHEDRGSVIWAPGTDLIWAGGHLLNAWPANPDENAYTSVRESQVHTLQIGGEVDLANPPQMATRELLALLPNGRQVVLSDLGHTPNTSRRTSRPRAPG